MIIAVLLMHAVLLPLLSFGLIGLIRAGYEEVFLDHVRAYARAFADVVEADPTLSSEPDLHAQLDGMRLGGRCVFAAIETEDRLILSTLNSDDDAAKFVEDFAFGEHADDIYYMSVPLEMGDRIALLKIGFDEGPTRLQIEDARDTILAILAVYLAASVIFMIGLSGLLSRPLQRLRQDSRKVASGDYSRHMVADSNIEEIRDLTGDLEAMRSKLVGINAQLQHEIVEREAAEAERHEIESRLHHMQRLDSIGTLAGGIAHEFNNILLPLALYTDLAMEDLPGDSPARAKLQRVLDLAGRAKGLSGKILTFSHQPDDAGHVARDLGQVVEEAMSMVRALIPSSIDMSIRVEIGAGDVLCDPAEIQQLVVNLCSNSYLALPSGGGHIAVEVAPCRVDAEFAARHPRLRVGQYVRLEVSDTGQGMDSDTIHRIFEPFFTTREVGKGSGLGLAVVHGIVVKHDAEIIVASEPGCGTTFSVYFPVAGSAGPSREVEDP